MGGGFRAEAVPYIDENGKTQDTDNNSVTVNNVTTSTTSLTEGWWHVNSDVTINTIQLSGTGEVHLILGDGCTLSGKTIGDSSTTASLTIYAQSTGDNQGKITLSDESGTTQIFNTSSVTINGGNINISSSADANIKGSKVTINGGNINISSSTNKSIEASCIWGTKSVTINGGTVNVTCTGSSAYIQSTTSGSIITINGGTVNVTSMSSSAYIQSNVGNVTITGGQVTVSDTAGKNTRIECGNGKLITLGYTNADDFILSPQYSASPKIADGKMFVNADDTSKTYSGTPTTSLAGIKLIPLTFTVKFDPNNGTGTMSNQEFLYGISQDLTANAFTHDGTFKGWNTKADGSGTSYTDGADGSKIFETYGENTLYAQWTLTNYKITYELNGGTNDSANPASYTADDAITLKAPTKTGYTFNGWTLDGSTVTEIAKGSTGDKTLTATWTPITYSIIYNLNGGSATNPATYTIETEAFTLTNPTKDGYTFNGWTGTDLTASAQTVEIKKGSTGNREYTANYSENQQGEQEQEQEQDSGSNEEQEQEQEQDSGGESVNTTLDDLANMSPEQKAAIKHLELTDTADKKITDLSQIKDSLDGLKNLTTLDLTKLDNLETADLSQLPSNVKDVNLQNTNITSLTLKGSTVEKVNAQGCSNLEEINAEGSESLTELNVSDTNITSINVKNCANLQKLECSSCDIDTENLTLDGCESLNYLDIRHNHFSWFNYHYSVLKALSKFLCSGQRVTGWYGKKTFDFSQFFNTGDIMTADNEASDSPNLEKIAGITAYDESGNELSVNYDSESGLAEFSGTPVSIKYYYETEFNNQSMDVTIIAEDSEDEANYLGSSGGGCNFGFSLFAVILVSALFTVSKH